MRSWYGQGGRLGRQRRDVGACRSARLVGAVRTVAVIVIYLILSEVDIGIGDAGKLVKRLVELGDYCERKMLALIHRHSGAPQLALHFTNIQVQHHEALGFPLLLDRMRKILEAANTFSASCRPRIVWAQSHR